MNFVNRFFFLILFSLSFLITRAQEIAIGQWKPYFPFKSVVSVTEADNRIFCAAALGIFYLDKSDNSINLITKNSGLSDVDIKKINYNKSNEALFIAYENTNIDVIKNNKIYNIPDIKRKSISGKKVINDILFFDRFAYLSTSFGIVVVDLEKYEIKDTYKIGIGGSDVEINDLTFDGSKFYAATSKGIYSANINSSNLANYESWTLDTLINDSTYNLICSFNNLIIANSKKPSGKDILYAFNGSNWSIYDSTINNSNRLSMEVCYDKLIIGSSWYIMYVFDNNNQVSQAYWAISPWQAIIDKDNILWSADNLSGLIKYSSSANDTIFPDGPATENAVDISLSGNALAIAPGGRSASYGNIWNNKGVSVLKNNDWEILNRSNNLQMDTLFDINCVIINPNDETKLYAGSWYRGLIEFKDNKITKIYDDQNSPLKVPPQNGTYRWIGIGGLCFDKDHNLWMTNSGSTNPVCVLKPDGTWFSYSLNNKISTYSSITQILIDTFGQKWILLPRTSNIAVFNDNGTPTTTNDDKIIVMNNQQGNGSIPGNISFCMASDLNGQVWVGTDKGIAVFYSPDKIFSNENFDAQQILIDQDGHAQYLFEFESVTSIVVDGANRKWVGTQKAGVFLMSPDGQKEIEHFTIDNSPLPSNTITAIAINNNNGEVFFGTDKGLISYKGTATLGGTDFNNVYAYPNPVPHNYEGLIAIKGLTTNARVKITDISGALIFETTAEGGQAIWDGKNFKDEKAQTGIYLVFCSNDKGTKTFVTKIMFIN
ncbi:MAG: T9SS type A sorting domain-containing protein [Bacteroidales bacterium]|nr:T9SS type A sorting domain-containing protein [Bacteroidales bacterium]